MPSAGSLKFIVKCETELDFKDEVERAPASTLCVCDVYAKWSGPCTALNKRVSNMSGDYIDYDIKWVEACAEGIVKFEAQRGKSKPLFVLYRSGLELDRMADGANGNELARLVEKHKGEKKPA